MESFNNVFLLAGEPYRVYINTLMSPIAGTRLHPLNSPQLVSFIVAGNDVLHVYSEDDDRVLRSLNSYFFTENVLQEKTNLSDSNSASTSVKRRNSVKNMQKE